MKVRFKEGNNISYEVLDGEAVAMFDDVTESYKLCIKLETLGWVPMYLLEPAKPDDVDTLEVLVKLTLQGVI